MAWPALIIAGAVVMAGSGIGASHEEGGNLLQEHYPAPSTEEKLASDQLLQLATKLFDESQGQDPAFYKAVFEGLPQTKMDDAARGRLKAKYAEISRTADSAAMTEAGKAFGENIDSLVNRGAITPVMADKMKIQNQAQVRAMMSTLSKKWQATEIRDARNMWLGEQRSGARTVDVLADTRARNQSLLNQTIDFGLRSALKRAGAEQQYEGAQMTANERVLAETRAAEYDFWGKMVFPGGGVNIQARQPTGGDTRGINDYYSSGMRDSSVSGYDWAGYY
ncbi:MAG: hypothetical protein V1897_13175 [Pseudomonadota bacterium]